MIVRFHWAARVWRKKRRDKRRDKKRETKEGKSVKLAGRVLQMKIKGKAARKGAIDWRLL
jgi:hypothetical protein